MIDNFLQMNALLVFPQQWCQPVDGFCQAFCVISGEVRVRLYEMGIQHVVDNSLTDGCVIRLHEGNVAQVKLSFDGVTRMKARNG